MDKNRNFSQHTNFWAKIKIVLKTRNFGKKIKILDKNKNFSSVQNLNVGWKIEMLDKNRNVGKKSKFWLSVIILDLYWNFAQKSKFC